MPDVPLEFAKASIRNGLGYIKSGRVKGLMKGAKDPYQVLTASLVTYSRAVDHFSRADAKDSGYNTVKSDLDNFKKEVIEYAKRVARDEASRADEIAKRLGGLVKTEETGRKFLGVPYARRPAQGYVGRSLTEGEIRVGSAKSRVERVRESLENKGLLAEADQKYFDNLKEKFGTASGVLEKQKDGHQSNIDYIKNRVAEERNKKETAEKDRKAAREKKEQGQKVERERRGKERTEERERKKKENQEKEERERKDRERREGERKQRNESKEKREKEDRERRDKERKEKQDREKQEREDREKREKQEREDREKREKQEREDREKRKKEREEKKEKERAEESYETEMKRHQKSMRRLFR